MTSLRAHMQRLLIGVMVGLVLPIPLAYAFDCSQAKSATEKTVCSSLELLKADQALNATYNADLAFYDEGGKALLQQEQRAWIQENESLCDTDAVCLQARYNDMAVLLSDTLMNNVSPSSDSTIHYKLHRVEKQKLFTVSLSYPVFSGSPAASVSKLNAWVKKSTNPCDGESNPDYDDEETISIPKINTTIVIFRHAYDLSCGGVHPSHGTDDTYFNLRSGNAIDLTELAVDQKLEGDLAKKIQTAGQQAHASDPECLDVYQEGADATYRTFRFSYKDKDTMLVSLDLPYAAQACADDFPMPMAYLKNFFAGKDEALAVLESLQN